MDPMSIIALLEAAAELANKGYNLYEQSKATMSETDAALVHQALVSAEAVTAKMRIAVDDALVAASDK